MLTSSDANDGTVSVRLIRDPLKLRGVPPQGTGFFSAYYPVFRGRGIILNSSAPPPYGLFASLNSFFTASSVLYMGCETEGGHIEAAVLAPSVMSLEAVCLDADRRPVAKWGSVLTRSLASLGDQTSGVLKNASRFRIDFPSPLTVRDRDLIVHQLEDLFPPAPTSESAAKLTDLVKSIHYGAKRLQLGGMYVIAAPNTYNGIDLVLSAVVATTTPEIPLTYVGLILYQSGADQTLLWIFRNEPVNLATLESQRSMAQGRLTRYPPVLQTAVRNLMPQSSQIGLDASFAEVLNTRVTPTDNLNALFRLTMSPYPREVLNRLGTFQPKYATTIDHVRGITNLKIQIRIIIELLYDLALASQRRCSLNADAV